MNCPDADAYCYSVGRLDRQAYLGPLAVDRDPPVAGLVCEACDAPAATVAKDWSEREDGVHAALKVNRHPLCAAHVRPDTITWLDGTKEEEPLP